MPIPAIIADRRVQGVSYGKPAACLLYDLAYHLGQDSAHMLWLALVGLTDHLVHNRCNGARASGSRDILAPAGAAPCWRPQLPAALHVMRSPARALCPST